MTLSQTLPPVNASTSAVPPVQASAEAPRPPSYANYSIMLVSRRVGGCAVTLMHNPKNELEFVDVNRSKDAFAAGYVPVRAVELAEFIGSLKEEVARLTADNGRLQNDQAKQAGTAPITSAELAAQQRAQAEEEKAARRRQMIQAWMMLNMNRPQVSPYQLPAPVVPMNPNANRLQTNCTTQTIGGTSVTNCN